MSSARLRFSHCVVAVGNVPSTGKAETGMSSPRKSTIGATTCWTNCGASFGAERRRVIFDADAAHPQIRALVEAGEATAVAYLDAIKLQFDLQGLMLAHGNNASALQAVLPDVLFRFQRREFFRVRTRDSAVAHLRHPASRGEMLTLRVLDVSVGGCALQLPAEAAPIEPGTSIDGVRLELDADTLLVAPLTVQHVSGGFGSNSRGSRLGCSFARLDGTSQRSLQRYIDLTQRREKFLLLG